MNTSQDVAIITLVKALKNHFGNGLKVINGWPNPKNKMVLPSLSVISLERNFKARYPTLIKTSPNLENPEYNDSVYLIGDYNYPIQLDLWCEEDFERSIWVEKIESFFNSQFLDNEQPTGLSLKLIDYSDMIARYDNVNYTYVDGEDSIQRSEYRAKFSVDTSYSKIVVKTDSRMDEIILEHSQNTGENNSDSDVESITI